MRTMKLIYYKNELCDYAFLSKMYEPGITPEHHEAINTIFERRVDGYFDLEVVER